MSSKETSSAALDYIAQIHRAVHAVGLFIDAEFGSEISQPEALVLIQLLGAGAATINDVHRAFLHRRSTLTSVLDRLEKKRYVVRETSASDRRSIRLSLTKTGRALARRLASALEKRCDDVHFAVTPARLISTLESTAQTFYGI